MTYLYILRIRKMSERIIRKILVLIDVLASVNEDN
jgi:hypothetical protein